MSRALKEKMMSRPKKIRSSEIHIESGKLHLGSPILLQSAMLSAPIPTVPRRRRHSGSTRDSDDLKSALHSLRTMHSKSSLGVVPPPRPKSTPGERPQLRRRRASPSGSEGEEEHGGGDDLGDEWGGIDGSDEEMQVDHKYYQKTHAGVASSASSTSGDSDHDQPQKITTNSVNTADDARPTRPLPTKSKNTALNPNAPSFSMSSNSNPNQPNLSNPHLLPSVAHVPRGPAAAGAGISSSSTPKRLFVVLEQACLEAYRISSGPKAGARGGNGKKGEGDVKYTLLNCDDHQGILAKTGRDIADARPDITHQVGFLLGFFVFFSSSLFVLVLVILPTRGILFLRRTRAQSWRAHSFALHLSPGSHVSNNFCFPVIVSWHMHRFEK